MKFTKYRQTDSHEEKARALNKAKLASLIASGAEFSVGFAA